MLQRERRFSRNPDSFRAINIDTGEGGSNMLWCHDLFGRDCVHYRNNLSYSRWHNRWMDCFYRQAIRCCHNESWTSYTILTNDFCRTNNYLLIISKFLERSCITAISGYITEYIRINIVTEQWTTSFISSLYCHLYQSLQWKITR